MMLFFNGINFMYLHYNRLTTSIHNGSIRHTYVVIAGRMPCKG